MGTVKVLLAGKGKEVWSVPPKASVGEALKLMAEKDVGALLVISEDRLVGVFSERDYARKAGKQGSVPADTPVSDLMSRKVLYVHPDMSTEECMALMTEKHFRHLPVLEGERVVGIVTIGDAVKQIISEQSFTIEQLGKYITESY